MGSYICIFRIRTRCCRTSRFGGSWILVLTSVCHCLSIRFLFTTNKAGLLLPVTTNTARIHTITMVSFFSLCVAGPLLIVCTRATETATTEEEEEEEVMVEDGAVEVVTTMTRCPTSAGGCGPSTGPTHGSSISRRTFMSRTSGFQLAVKRKLKNFDVLRRFGWVLYSSKCIIQLANC